MKIHLDNGSKRIRGITDKDDRYAEYFAYMREKRGITHSNLEGPKQIEAMAKLSVKYPLPCKADVIFEDPTYTRTRSVLYGAACTGKDYNWCADMAGYCPEASKLALDMFYDLKGRHAKKNLMADIVLRKKDILQPPLPLETALRFCAFGYEDWLQNEDGDLYSGVIAPDMTGLSDKLQAMYEELLLHMIIKLVVRIMAESEVTPTSLSILRLFMELREQAYNSHPDKMLRSIASVKGKISGSNQMIEPPKEMAFSAPDQEALDTKDSTNNIELVPQQNFMIGLVRTMIGQMSPPADAEPEYAEMLDQLQTTALNDPTIFEKAGTDNE